MNHLVDSEKHILKIYISKHKHHLFQAGSQNRCILKPSCYRNKTIPHTRWIYRAHLVAVFIYSNWLKRIPAMWFQPLRNHYKRSPCYLLWRIPTDIVGLFFASPHSLQLKRDHLKYHCKSVKICLGIFQLY